jgi:hypothetical protein
VAQFKKVEELNEQVSELSDLASQYFNTAQRANDRREQHGWKSLLIALRTRLTDCMIRSWQSSRNGRDDKTEASQELRRVLLELKASLKPRGVLFSSYPRGHNEEGWSQGRYGVYHDLDAWRHYMSVAGFVELSHYYRPAGVSRERQPWLASVWRRLAS